MVQANGVPRARQVDAVAVIEAPKTRPRPVDHLGWAALVLAVVVMFVADLPWLPLATFAAWLPLWLVVRQPWRRDSTPAY